jgi:hypothetical protein
MERALRAGKGLYDGYGAFWNILNSGSVIKINGFMPLLWISSLPRFLNMTCRSPSRIAEPEREMQVFFYLRRTEVENMQCNFYNEMTVRHEHFFEQTRNDT